MCSSPSIVSILAGVGLTALLYSSKEDGHVLMVNVPGGVFCLGIFGLIEIPTKVGKGRRLQSTLLKLAL